MLKMKKENKKKLVLQSIKVTKNTNIEKTIKKLLEDETKK